MKSVLVAGLTRGAHKCIGHLVILLENVWASVTEPRCMRRESGKACSDGTE